VATSCAFIKQAFAVVWQHVNLNGRNEFRKHVAETVRELAEIRIENRHRFGGVIPD
jgi:hypothetical protein